MRYRKLGEETKTLSGGMISGFDYSQPANGYPSGYDAVGNVLKIVEKYGHANVKDRTVVNVYDHAYRLDTETIAETGGMTVVTNYDYDDANNRTQKTVTGGSAPGTWVSAYGTTADGYNSNQLKSVTKGATVTSFLYDLNGNRSTKKVGGATVQTHGYDFENRLVSLTDSVKGTFAYAYDHRTRRVGRDESSAGGLSEELSFAGGTSVQEYTSGSGTPTVEYIRGSDYGGGIGGVLYTIRGGSTRSYNAYNSRGDVISKTDDGGIIDWQASYEAFGKRTQEEGDTLDRQKANTKDEDPTGLLNEGMRFRDLEFGIFLTRDPAGFVDGPNVYTYVRQNPWTFFDPLGLRKDKSGFDWKGTGHHTVPVSVVDNAGFCDEAKEVFDKATLDTPNGHDYSSHKKYNDEVNSELQDFFKKEKIDSLDGVSASRQKELAEKFVSNISKTKNEYIKAFNSVAPSGPKMVQQWYRSTGQFISLRSTGKLAREGGRLVSGLRRIPGLKYAVSAGVYGMSLNNSYGQGDPAWKAHGKAILDTASPTMGPSDNTATWDMSHRELSETQGTGFGPMFEALANPFSPRWAGWMIYKGILDP